MSSGHRVGRRRPLGLALVVLAAACAAPIRRAPVLLFFPPAPELPRIQYLTSFGSSQDVETQTAFSRFVIGEKQKVRLDKPYGVAMHGGRIYVCDTNATVVVFDLQHKVFESLKGAVGPGQLIQPTNIWIEGDGTKYVADPLRGQVVVFDQNDDYVRAYGEPGPWKPVDVAVFEDRLYVADVANGRVRVFDKRSGEAIDSIGNEGDPSARLDRPTNLAVDGEGSLYVTDFGRFQVVVFDREGRWQRTIGGPGDGPGHFARPKGLAVDRAGRLFAVDASFGNVQIFNPQGRVLMFFGEGGETPGSFLLPAKVALDYEDLDYFREYVHAGFEMEYLILVTSQLGPHSVSVLAYGREQGRAYPTDEELLQGIEERKQSEMERSPPPARP